MGFLTSPTIRGKQRCQGDMVSGGEVLSELAEQGKVT